MKTTYLLALLLAVMYMASCGHIPRDRAHHMYDKMRSVNDTLDNMTKSWYQYMNKSIVNKDFSALQRQRVQMGLFIARSRKAVGDLKIPDDAAAIADSETVFLQIRAQVVSDIYTVFEGYNDQTPDNVIRHQVESLGNDLEKELMYSAAIKHSLQVYALRNKLKTEKK